MNKTNSTAPCIPFSESAFRYFERIASYFEEGGNWQKFYFPGDFDIGTGLNLYKYGNQGYYGNLNETTYPYPAWWDILGK